MKKNKGKICILHSSKKGKSIIGYEPKSIFKGENIKEFKKFVQKNKDNLLIGYLSYDLGYELHKIKKTAKDDLKLPKIYFQAFDRYEIISEHKNRTIKRLLSLSSEKHASINFEPKRTKNEYNNSFKTIKKHIKEGDIYQINLTRRLKGETLIPPRELFWRTIKKNPVNFSAYIEGENFEIISASPERFIKIENKKIQTTPIKGTRPRGETKTTDEKFRKELIESEKEKAELNMITDLLRNDMGKVCKIGTVKVKHNRLLKKYSTVWHTYSEIIGEINTSPIDALLSMFPGGSITGCPKKRAMEIIDKLEPITRGVYTGVIGYIAPNQKTLDFNIAIRTLIKKEKTVYLQVGGGIVEESKQEAEFLETMDKAKSFTQL